MFTSKEDEFKRHLSDAIASSLTEIGEVVVKSVKDEADSFKRTGHLRDSTASAIEEGSVIIYNDAEYAAFVELGTYKMGANPFMRRGIAKSAPALIQIVKAKLGV